MRKRLIPILGLFLALACALPGAARSPGSDVSIARRHLTAIMLIQRWAQAIYGIVPAAAGGERCEPRVGEWVDNGDDTYTRETIQANCLRSVITNYGRSSSDYDLRVYDRETLLETLLVRTVERFNGGPAKVRFEYRLADGSRVEFDQELQLLIVPSGPAAGANLYYGLISSGEVRLGSGDCLEFTLRQTKARNCLYPLTSVPLPEEVCREWFDGADPATAVARPDRLEVRMGCVRETGRMTLSVPISNPMGSIPDFAQPATGRLVLGGKTMSVTLTTDEPEVKGWKYWRTRGSGFDGTFELQSDFSGRGQVYRRRARRPRANELLKAGPGSLQFAASWNERGIGTILLNDGQTMPAGPFAGALEFGSLKWSGLASAFGPTPGL